VEENAKKKLNNTNRKFNDISSINGRKKKYETYNVMILLWNAPKKKKYL
jgi:hypothetical protein